MTLAALFLFLFALILSLSAAVRYHSWNVAYRWEHWLGFAVWLAGFAYIHRQVLQHLPERDPYLLPLAALLSGWGLLTIWRLSLLFGLRQTIWLAVCLLVFRAALGAPTLLTLLRRYKYIWLTSGLVLTALTFFFGTYPAGSGPRLWLGCCGVYLQPSEPLKLLLIVYLAAYLADNLPVRFKLLEILTPTLVLSGAALVILVAQRDLGTASLFLLIYSLIVYLASGRRRILGIGGGAILAAGVIGYLLFEVIRIRITAWINPWLDPLGSSYQIVQSLITVAAGGISGSGIGMGNPAVVPVAHSDFIFASIAEETGLVGVIGIVLLIALMGGRGILTALRASNRYQRFLAAGLSVYLLTQSIFIIGGNLRLLPLTGVTLPFVSYGGSSLLTGFITLALLLLITNNSEKDPAALPNPIPFLAVTAALLAGLVLTALLGGWWAVIRSPALLSRPDNPRWAITDRFVPRGSLLDRRNEAIAETVGERGEFRRRLLHPELGPVVGYTHPVYGQASLEAALDPYLRGIQGNTTLNVWMHHLLYAQRPPGLDVRLSLDLDLQARADALMAGNTGALVLLNAASGEVLVMSSHPNFDPNRMDELWSEWIVDESAPLVNRAAQGRYPLGATMGIFMLAEANAAGVTPPLPVNLNYPFNGGIWNCARSPQEVKAWADVLAAGCPAPAVTLVQQFSPRQLSDLVQRLGFFSAPQVLLPVAPATPYQILENTEVAALGQAEVVVSPLQMSLAVAALTNDGNRPSPLLAAAVNTPHQGWVILPNDPSTPVFPAAVANNLTRMMTTSNLPLWDAVATARTPAGNITWYLAGNLPDWQGTPLALALVLEADAPVLAQQIGLNLLRATIEP